MTTDIQELADLRRNWSVVYRINHARCWQAVALFGTHDVLKAGTAEQLRQQIFRHYGPKTEGYPFPR
jgi:hypothetical protein